ncbi:hypothetical protein GJ744_005915 [Endocarpon pusillum]|uniref:DUF7791 domain-containing protein n=1 Tax=Endocarpon pusillum TaxID=364733 RepID=A0A8H7ATE7_9EURO|nr:hypothetical protein GJ744_005915 [Endocarpon pusillum]
MMNGQTSLAKGPAESLGSVGIYEWTVKRLLSVLRYFLIQKPSSVRICFFIDGLDEFDGEEDDLLEIIRFMNIEKTVNDKLRSKLESLFPSEKEETENMIKDVCYKAQGVFLWLDLTIKALVNAIRNGDNIEELSERLQTTPDTIEGVYIDMFNRLDKLYLATAAKYFRFLKQAQVWPQRPWTLLSFVCVDYSLWQRILSNDLACFESSEFFNICHQIENRILTRCAGLVEINDQLSNVFERLGIIDRWQLTELGIQQREGSISCHFREVNFIHRSALEFLETHHQEFFQEPNWHLEARLALARSQLGEISVIPIVKSELYKEGGFVEIHKPIKRLMDTLAAFNKSEATERADRAFEDAAIEMVDQTFQVIKQVHVNLSRSETSSYEEYSRKDFHLLMPWFDTQFPLYDCHGFAAYFGCRNYVSHHLSLRNCSIEEYEYLLACIVGGIQCRICENERVEGYFPILEELVRRGANPNLLARVQTYCYLSEVSACGKALEYLIPNWRRPGFSISFVKTLLSHGADVNTSIFTTFGRFRTGRNLVGDQVPVSTKSGIQAVFVLEESPLSYVERHMTYEGSDDLKEIRNLLRSHGALKRRRCRLFQFIESGSTKWPSEMSTWYRLSQGQSDRIVELCKWESAGDYLRRQGEVDTDSDAVESVAAEIRSSLIEADIVNDSTYVLRSSFKSEVGET